MTTRRNLIVSSLCLALLASCGPPPLTPTYPDIRFSGQPPLMLDAGQIEIRTLYQPTDADRAFPVAPVQAAQNWGRDRLRASGRGGPARMTIADASATVKDLPTQGGVSGAFTDQVSQEYSAALDVSIEILDDHAMAIRSIRVTASRTKSALQSASPVEREQIRYQLVRELMADFDRQAEAQLRNTFGLYLLSR